MVGVTIGLLVVAAATVMISGQLVENRRLLLSAQIQQDLRAAADIMTRELRRSAYLSEKAVGSTPSSLDTIDSYVGSSLAANLVRRNPWQADLAVTNSCQDVAYSYTATTTNTLDGTFGFRINSTTGTLQSSLGNTQGFQDLTDGNTMRVTSLCVTLANAGTVPEALPCAKACSDGTASCWPTYNVRQLSFTITAEAKADPNIKREVKGLVRVRNDRVNFAIGSLICPV